MVLIDEQDWPLVLVRWDVPISDMDTDFCGDSLASWMKRAQRFAVLSIQPSELAGTRQQRAFKPATQFGQHLGGRCVGIALTWTDGRRSERDGVEDADRLSQKLGCPVQAFLDCDAALGWLRAQLAVPTVGAPAARAQATRTARISVAADPGRR